MKHYDKLELTSYVTGDVFAEKRAAIEKHLAECEQCHLFTEKLECEKTKFLDNNSFDELDLEESETKIHYFPKNVIRSVSSVAALLVLVVTVQFTTQFATQSDAVPTVAFKGKGGSDFSILVETHNGTITERESDVYYPGERIQVCYNTVVSQHLVLLSIDGTGKLSRYFPSRGRTSLEVPAGVSQPLPNSIRLDEYIGSEKLVMVFSKDPILLDSLESQITAAFSAGTLDSLTLGGKSSVVIRSIEKKVRDE